MMDQTVRPLRRSPITREMVANLVRFDREKRILIVKWAASIVQIMGYTATAFGMTPLNIYLFLVGLVGWFTVGLLWRDKAIMLIHVVALAAMVAGLASTGS